MGNKVLDNLKNAIEDVNIENALLYCASSEEFYIECLKDYGNGKRKDMIEKSFSEKDWKRYALEVHTLKSNSRTLGFEKLGDIAEKMQIAAEQQDISYIEEKHNMLMTELCRIIKAIDDCVV